MLRIWVGNVYGLIVLWVDVDTRSCPGFIGLVENIPLFLWAMFGWSFGRDKVGVGELENPCIFIILVFKYPKYWFDQIIANNWRKNKA